MKRFSQDALLATYRALFEDLGRWNSKRTTSYTRDYQRVEVLVKTRGVTTVFVDFPKYAKLFDLALSRGSLSGFRAPLLGSSGDFPEFMSEDFHDVFDEGGQLSASPCLVALTAIRQVLLLCKKVVYPCSEEKIRDAVSAFFKTEDTLRVPSSSWDCGFGLNPSDLGTNRASFEDAAEGGSLYEPRDHYSIAGLRAAQAVCDMVVPCFPSFCADSLIGQHGPGAVADLRSGGDKYSFPTWSRRLERVFPRDHHDLPNVGLAQEQDTCLGRVVEGQLSDDKPSKLIAVPKTVDKPRLIASEPTSNQFIQGALRKYFLEAIARTVLRECVSIHDQRPSQQYAALASKDSRFSTVDLKDASDRLTCWTVERAFRRNLPLLDALSACRSSTIKAEDYGVKLAKLRKYAPQGNATVFPIQSIIYALFSIAAVMVSAPRETHYYHGSFASRLRKAARTVRVFGDDICLPTHALPMLSMILESCQLKVNGQKSHYQGNFAEACGFDGFRGRDITPAYLRHIGAQVNPEEIVSLVEVSNNFYAKGLHAVANTIAGWIPERYQQLIPVTKSDGFPIKFISYTGELFHQRKRWSEHLHRYELSVLSLRSKVTRVQRDSWVSLTQYFTEAPSAETNWSSGWNKTNRLRLSRTWAPQR